MEHDSENVLFFASGVSNSLETNLSEYNREEKLLIEHLEQYPDKLFIYFSSCSIYDSSKTDSLYVKHKLKMEQLVAQKSRNFLILRVSNAVGKKGNPNLLMNYLVSAALNNKPLQVHINASRNFIDSEDVKNLTLQLIASKYRNKIINLAYVHNFKIIEIIHIIASTFTIKPNIELIDAGGEYSIAITEIKDYFKGNMLNKQYYLQNILDKYYT